jgi:two-component system sensor histidine kinase VanS
VLTEALLTLADADHDTARLTTLDLVPVTSAVIDENTETADQAGVRISTQLAPGIVRGDETLLRQLISNLVQNAIVHNRADGTVQVSTARAPHGGMVLEVTNTGAPLDEEALATFTEPFTRGAGRTRRRGERHVGSGLGLAIVASVARVHGATLDLTPRDGGGLRARVTFPAAGVAAGRLE